MWKRRLGALGRTLYYYRITKIAFVDDEHSEAFKKIQNSNHLKRAYAVMIPAAHSHSNRRVNGELEEK